MIKNIKKFLNTNIFFLILLTIVAFSLYGKSINFGLTELDDNGLITNNVGFISYIENIPKLFTMSPYYNNSTSYYRPMLSVSFAIEAFFVRDNLKLYHVTNIILFVLSLYLFYLFCMELKLNSIITKFVLLVVAVHPMLTSIVVWIPGRNDSLLTLFFIASFVFFIRYLNTQKIKYAFFFGFFFILSLFTKETFLLLIPTYFVYLLFYKRDFSKKKLLFLFTSLIPFVIIFFILRKISIVTFGYEHYFLKINVIFVNLVKYTFMFFYNFFVPEYIPMMLFNAGLSLKIIIYNCLFTLILIFVLYKKILPVKIFVFSILIVFLSLAPTFLQEEIVYLNHRFFVSSIGFVIILVSVLDCLFTKVYKLKPFFIVFFIIAFVGLFCLSYKQADKYKDNEAFWVNSYIDSPNFYLVCQNLSKIYMDRGMLKEAEYYAKKTVELKQSYATFIQYAIFLIKTGDLEQAETALIEMEKDVKKNKDLCNSLLSEVYYKQNNYEKALQHALKAYDLAYTFKPSYCEQLATIYDAMENYDEEIKMYEKLLNYDRRNKDYKNKMMELKEKINNRKMKNA